MKRLYLETNYIISQAFEQDLMASTIFPRAAQVGAEICLPSFCIQEALTTVQLRHKTTDKFGKSLQTKVEELRDDQSPTALTLKSTLNNAIVESGKLRSERELRIATVIASLSSVRLIHLEHLIALRAVNSPIIRGAADNLILHAVVEDARNMPCPDMMFFTLNFRDFEKPGAKAALSAVAVKLLTSSSNVLTWLQR